MHPASTGHIVAFQPAFLHSATRSDVLASPCKVDGTSCWGSRPAVCLLSTQFHHLCQFLQHGIMSPSVATLGQSRFAARQDMLEASIDGVAKGVEQLVEVSGTSVSDLLGSGS